MVIYVIFQTGSRTPCGFELCLFPFDSCSCKAQSIALYGNDSYAAFIVCFLVVNMSKNGQLSPYQNPIEPNTSHYKIRMKYSINHDLLPDIYYK